MLWIRPKATLKRFFKNLKLLGTIFKTIKYLVYSWVIPMACTLALAQYNYGRPLKVPTDRHSRLDRNKSASATLLIIKACLDPPRQGAQICQNNSPACPVMTLLWTCFGRPEHLGKAYQNSFKASSSVKACYESWGRPNPQGLLRAALEVCYESIWGIEVEAILVKSRPWMSICGYLKILSGVKLSVDIWWCIFGLRYAKRPLIAWIGVIPKEGQARPPRPSFGMTPTQAIRDLFV